MLTGELVPDEGSIRLGTNLEMVTLDQKRESLNPDDTLKDALTGGHGDTISVNGEPRHVIGYMKDFLFSPEQAGTALKVLSGGERGRVMLARALAKQSNLLILDEPTNDLDLETLDLLQEVLADYRGTVMLISHDRSFLDSCVTSVIAWEDDGHWQEYVGGYSDMIDQRRRDAAGVDTSPQKDRKKDTRRNKIPATNHATTSKPKLNFKDKHALKTLPGMMEDLHNQIGSLQKTMADPMLYSRDPETFQSASAKLLKAENALGMAEEQWLELEMKREEIEG
jgi:ATP-binding cassette subfamily F protein uup